MPTYLTWPHPPLQGGPQGSYLSLLLTWHDFYLHCSPHHDQCHHKHTQGILLRPSPLSVTITTITAVCHSFFLQAPHGTGGRGVNGVPTLVVTPTTNYCVGGGAWLQWHTRVILLRPPPLSHHSNDHVAVFPSFNVHHDPSCPVTYLYTAGRRKRQFGRFGANSG